MRTIMTTGLLAVASVCFAPAQTFAAHTAQQPSDAMVIHSAGLEAMAVDQRDQGLVRAVNMLVENRLPELVTEIDDQFPAATVQFVMKRLLGPWTLQAGLLPDVELDIEALNAGEPLPFYLQMTFPVESAEQAAELAGRFDAMVPMRTQDSPDHHAMRLVPDVPFPVFFGSVDNGGEHAFVIALNEMAPNGAASFGELALPADVTPSFAAAFDSRQLQPLIDALAQYAEDAGGQEQIGIESMLTQLRGLGLIGEDASVISMAMGHDAAADGPLRYTMRYTNYRQLLERTGMWPSGMLSVDDMQRVPADATYAQLTRADYSGMLQSMFWSMPDQEMYESVLEQVESFIGIHPQRDLMDHFGELMGVYMSDTTGSGGLLSLAGFVQVTDEAALSESLTRLTSQGNQMAQMFARGYVRFAEQDVNGEQITTLMFPGLPVPLEMSFAIRDGYLYAAMSPQGLFGAMNQGDGDQPGLMDNPRFASSVGQEVDGAMQVTFYDSPRTVRDGYALSSLAMSALANAARSPVDAERNPGVLLPSLAELSADVQPAMYLVRVDGADMVLTGTADRSLLTLATSKLGLIGGAGGLVVPAAMVGTALPALGKAREQARLTTSLTNLRQVSVAVRTYAAEFDDRTPEDVQQLVDEGYIPAQLLMSPVGPLHDGHGDYFFNLSGQRLSDIEQPGELVLGYDRAAYLNSDKTAVVFFNGRTEIMNAWEFQMLIDEQPNADVDFKLPGW